MIKRIISVSLLFNSLAIVAMKPSGAAVSESGWVNALNTGNVADVEKYLKQGANADEFSRIPSLSEVGMGTIEFRKLDPLDVAWFGKGTLANRLKIAVLLIQHGADKEMGWRTMTLVFAISNGNPYLVKELLKFGAKQPTSENLEDLVTKLEKVIAKLPATERANYNEIIQILKGSK